jgi:RimJ/RimL family protein N-acetyltransferase
MSATEHITKKDLLEHLTMLDVEGLRWRFGYSANETALEMYVNGIPDTDYILGIRDSLTLKVVAAVHLALDKDGHTAELGISTLKEYRRKGYAERLLRYTVDMLRNRNIGTLYTVCLPDNQPLLRLFQKMNITTITSNDGDKEARVSIPMVGIDSIMHEMYNHRIVAIDNAMRPWAVVWQSMFNSQRKVNDNS